MGTQINIGGILMILIILGIVGLIVYLCIYNKKANARVTGDYDPETDSRIPAPSSALSVLWKIAVIVCFIVLFVKLDNIADEISGTYANFNNLQSRINAISGTVAERINQALEQQNTLFTDRDYRVLSTDWDTLQTEIEYYVIPKEIPEDASITLRLEGKDYPMEKKGGEWSARILLNPFRNINSKITATVTGNGTIKNESWYADIVLKNKVNSVSNMYPETIENGMIRVSGGFEIYLPSGIGVKNVKMTVKNGDTVIRTVPVPEKALSYFYDDSISCFGTEVNDKISVKNGDVIVYSLTWESEKGLHGEAELFGMEITMEKNNTYVTQHPSVHDMWIYDKDGNRLD